MNEHPILFSRKMVRAIMAEEKSQTRRIMKPQPSADFSPIAVEWYTPIVVDRNGDEQPGAEIFGVYGDEEGYRCPYGATGDLLWVRETFATYSDGFVFKADFPDNGFGAGIVNLKTGEVYPLVWKPSIHMPRKASRLTLEITELRVERLNDISEGDAIAEGCQAWAENGQVTDTAVSDYAHLWNEINLERGYSWESNPFVWVISFCRGK